MPDKLVSICIPAYENLTFLKQLLDSILIQNYPKIEVIISDDSAGEDIKNALPSYVGKLDIKYFKNTPPLKTPANWNHALDKASGDLLMLIHHDDWLNGQDVISKYVRVFDDDAGIGFAFCRSMAFSENDAAGLNARHQKILNSLAIHPEGLLLGNVIGPPSNVMIRKTVSLRYTVPLMWLVDVEYYMRLVQQGYKYYFIDEPLISVGLHDQQTTAFVQQNKKIILKEHLLLAISQGSSLFSDIRIYDLYWRLMRNYGIRSTDQLKELGIEATKLPVTLKQILNFQKKIPELFLKNRVASKILMFTSYSFGKRGSNSV
ncbi:MAG TPA: glycosyltransferase family 2 protein [Chitinophagaceae bacterium]|jgi:glycosyltransferase involved in cell wall biosynthesis|nr:glycosyltransferase family 2 protein [Chitinophagaceae bacterium]